MDDFTPAIQADGGKWSEAEVLGNQAIVKVIGVTPATLSAIAAAPGFTRIPLDRLDDPLSSLSTGQRTAIRNIILNAGYTLAEVNARFPNLANNTVGDALRFLATRRNKPRYDAGTDSIILDGATQACRSLDVVDREVS
jgi:hypothetical protein